MAHDHELDDSSARGAARLVTWTKDGTLVPLAELARAWGLELRDMEALVQRGDLFEVCVNESPHVPVELIALGRERSAEICHFLEGQSASSKLVFLKRPHGGLGGKTVVEALQSGTPLDRICELAQASALT